MDLSEDIETDTNRISDDEDGVQDDDDGGHRRRFCNERADQRREHRGHKQQMAPTSSSSSQPNRPLKIYDRRKAQASHVMRGQNRMTPSTSAPFRRQPSSMPHLRPPIRKQANLSHRHNIKVKPQGSGLANDKFCTTKKIYKPQDQSKPSDTVIYINPMFVKNFLKKAMIMKHTPDDATKETIRNVPVEEVKFLESPADAVQAAASMAIIRLVTECIADDSKRDEQSNKLLASRLMLKIEEYARRDSGKGQSGDEKEPMQ